jgi:LuxR family maltose regulon positive regulatory protein
MELAHLEVKEQLTRLTADDLRFQHAEILQFYEKRGFHLEDSDLELIEKYSEGWAASLVAIALSMDNQSRIKEGILNCNKNLDQYFLEEVFGGLDGRYEDFLFADVHSGFALRQPL